MSLVTSISLNSLKSSLSLHTLLPVVLFIVMLPHLSSTTPVFSVFILFVLIWFVLHTLGIIPLPTRLLRFILVLSAITLLIMNYGFLFSQKAALTLLCMTLSLKFMEVKNELDRRNIFLILFLGYFLLVAHFLYSQSLLLSLFSFICVIVLTLLLSAFNRKPQAPLPIKEHLRLISKLFIKALPIAIILFLFFPRIPGPLWSLPDDSHSGSTGLSDKMYPGSVSELVDSDEVAFRVEFKDQPPAAHALYWRGPVLTNTDGFLWTQNKQIPLKENFSSIVQNSTEAVSYTVTLEPHNQKWLFALELPAKLSGDTIKGYFLSNDLQAINKTNINQLTQYQVTSMTKFHLNKISEHELKESLTLPELVINPKSRALGKKWREESGLDSRKNRQIVLTALNYFKDNPFYYTKKPAIMIENPSDQFLFDQRRGFCEHYASSFVILMRAAQIPARVVTGYQGLEKNEVGNYYLVRQSSAHAWAEVWLEQEGWIRVDPTSMIPPGRIESDIFSDNLDRLNFSMLNLPQLAQFSTQQKTALYQLWKSLKQSLDNIKHHWNNWILGYDQTKQSLLLHLMGLTANWQTLLFLLIAGMIFIITLFWLINYYKKNQQSDPTLLYFTKFINKLNKAGMTIKLSEGPDAIRIQAIKQFPEQQQAIQSIMDQYIRIRYASQTDRLLIKQLIAKIAQFKI